MIYDFGAGYGNTVVKQSNGNPYNPLDEREVRYSFDGSVFSEIDESDGNPYLSYSTMSYGVGFTYFENLKYPKQSGFFYGGSEFFEPKGIWYSSSYPNDVDGAMKCFKLNPSTKQAAIFKVKVNDLGKLDVPQGNLCIYDYSYDEKDHILEFYKGKKDHAGYDLYPNHDVGEKFYEGTMRPTNVGCTRLDGIYCGKGDPVNSYYLLFKLDDFTNDSTERHLEEAMKQYDIHFD